MQITGGFLKGRKLVCPSKNLDLIRPLRTRIRKALFDILGQNLFDFKVLDLFAGTGALGIEAISRGASFAVFVDNNPISIGIIKKNLEKFNLLDKAQVFKLDLPKGLKILSKKFQNFFDLVFITPPYEKGLSLKTMKNFPENLLKKEALIIVEEKTGIFLPEKINNFNLLQKRSYGETTLHIYQGS
uniref:16S rRNA (Guanine(966)-N(2))-methyltransferase RsmD n=1 Tax=Thermodesulfobacterium geofontis TaxID=1295609 RepID=A0A7V5XGQ9_9BACT